MAPKGKSPLGDIANTHDLSRASAIICECTHPGHHLLNLLLSGRSDHLKPKQIKAQFFPHSKNVPWTDNCFGFNLILIINVVFIHNLSVCLCVCGQIT